MYRPPNTLGPGGMRIGILYGIPLRPSKHGRLFHSDVESLEK